MPHVKLRELRIAQGLTQEELAEKMNISQSSYSRLESGETVMNVFHIIKLFELFQNDAIQLIISSSIGIEVFLKGKKPLRK